MFIRDLLCLNVNVFIERFMFELCIEIKNTATNRYFSCH